ncbi:MAG TPA: DUF1579 domain-containing protein [Chitinophagaceae bacterium]
MSSDKFETSRLSGVHSQLSRMAGEWEGITRTFFEEGVVADESPMSGTIKPIMDGRFMLHEYKGSFGGKPFSGIAIYGYHLEHQKFQCAWVDSFHTGTSIFFSESNTTDKLFTVLGSYGEPGGTPWGWRTEIEMPNSEELFITAYNITPDGINAGGVETRYSRKK